MKNYIITIGRQYGSGGREVGIRLAQKLNAEFYDKELLTQAAQDSGISCKIFENFDEKKANSLMYSLSMGNYSFTGDTSKPLALRVYLAQFDSIKKIAKSENNAVIVGRCSDYILKDCKNLVSIFITADSNDRIETIAEREKLTPAQAKSVMTKMDKNRESYYNYHTEYKWGVADTYDLCINTSKSGIDGAVDLILNYINNL